MLRPTTITFVVLAALTTACATDDRPEIAAPQHAETVTVTETVTETLAPEGEPSRTEPEDPDTEEPPAVATTSVCDDVEAEGGESLAFVFVERPASGSQVAPGFEATGCANAFEATYEWELLDHDGAELASGFGTATCGTGCVGDFSFTVDYTVGEVQVGSLRVFTRSAEDGSIEDLNTIPLRLTP